jgi:3-deoxy-7-phosphoheptulonate synthase
MKIGSLDTWRGFPMAQQPQWPDGAVLGAVAGELARMPPLVFAGECDQLKERLSAVARGEACVLQGGDCAETFAGTTADSIRGKLATLLQMGIVLGYAAGIPVVKIGRLAGQFAKPRSHGTEVRDGVRLPVYRGDAVNALEFTPEARTPDPRRLLRACHYSAAALNLCRALTQGGYADLRRVHEWNSEDFPLSSESQRYEALAGDIDRMMAFLRASGSDPQEFRAAEFYSSHEALILEYERALTRIDSRTGMPYDMSAHFLWIGDRTRALDRAHVEFVRHLRNPIGVKLGPSATPQDALSLIERLDPEHEPGRLTFISRMGASRVNSTLTPIVEAVTASGAQVVWVCDPMHGNTFETSNGRKTRRIADILAELTAFFEMHRALGTHPGGIHVEFTGDDVTECIGGSRAVTEEHLPERYETACDPRLNRSQSLDIAFRVADLYRR